MQSGPTGGGDTGDTAGVSSTAADSSTPAPMDSGTTQQQEPVVEPAPTPAPDNKPKAGQPELNPVPTLQPTLQPRPMPIPSPQKTMLLFMQKIIEELKQNLGRIKKRKKGINPDEEEEDQLEANPGANPGKEMKVGQEQIDSLRNMADKYLKPDGLAANTLGQELATQLKGLADHFLDRMQNQLNSELGKGPGINPAKTKDDQNERGEPLEGGMTEGEIIDAGRQLGGMLKDRDFQKALEADLDEEEVEEEDLYDEPAPEEEQDEESLADLLDQLGNEADSLKSTSSVELTLPLMGGGGS